MHVRIVIILAMALVTLSAGLARGQDDEVRRHIESLQSAAAGQRISGAMNLNALGGSARAAVPALVKALADEDEIVRIWAVLALGKMLPESRVAAAELRSLAASDPVRIVRDNAKVVLAKFGSEPNPLSVPVPAEAPAAVAPTSRVDALIRRLASSSPAARLAAVRRLGALGPAAASALKSLQRVVESDPHPAVRAAALKAVAAIEKNGPEPERRPDAPGARMSIHGDWGTTIIDGEERVTGQLRFHPNGRFEISFEDQDGGRFEHAGAWSLTGNSLRMQVDEQEPVVAEITWLGPDRFSVKADETTITYDRRK